MSILLLGLLFPLAAATLGSSPSTRSLGIASETGASGQKILASEHVVIENSERPFTALFGGTENSSFTMLVDVDAKIPPHSTAVQPRERPGKAPTGGSAQRGAASLPWLLRAAMEACRRVLSYYGRHAGLMNLDALLGTRIAEGQFHLGLQDLAAGGGEGREDTWARQAAAAELRRLFAAAALVGDAAEAHVRRENRQYTGLLSLLQRGFWRVRLAVPPLPEPKHTPELVLPGQEQLSPEQTDMCLWEVGSERGCVVTGGCWELMTAEIYSGYSLTHQVLYLIAGVQAGCGARLNHLAAGEGVTGGVGDILAHMCSAVLAEAREISKAGFPELHRDLFMEQGALCGLLGYRAFFPEAWVRHVLSWQRREGCFGDAKLLYSDTQVVHLQDSSHKRVRREELAMTGGCLAHRSAVALGYLAAFTRYAAVNASANTTRHL